MSPWLESLGVLILAAGGIWLGAWFSRLPRNWWFFGYGLPLLAIALYGASCWVPALNFVPPVSWIMAGRTRFALTGFLSAMLFTTLLARTPKRRDRNALRVLMAVVVLFMSMWPFLAPAFNRRYLAGLETRMDADGVCRQNTDYTCGPASAVTALRKLGFPADEGRIAILAWTSSTIGTPPDVLANALQREYGPAGLQCEYRVFHDASELRDQVPVLAVIKFNFLEDHYVTVLGVTNNQLIVGDPLSGLNQLDPSVFEREWRHTGIVLSRRR